MNIRANNGIWANMFGVPCVVADNFLKLASGDQIKVLLYIMRNSGRECSESEIAANTGVSPQQAADAVMFWQQVNVLSAAESSLPAPIMQTMTAPPPAEAPATNKQIPPRQRQNLTPSEIAKLMKGSDEIAEMFKTAETMFGTLTHTQQNSLIWIHDFLGLRAEVIITLLSYCISVEKSNSGYIEKIAHSWSENDINTLDAAIDEVERMKSSHDFTAQIMKMFEMKRRPTTKQKEFIDLWKAEAYSSELIKYAYEITIENIDKLSFEYINKILVSWKNSGLMTASDVRSANADYRKRKSEAESESDDDLAQYKEFINVF